MAVLERRHPLFDEPTTAALAGRDLYLVANPQLGKPADTVKLFMVLRLDSGLR
jgi:hypothetical protein